MSLRDLQLLTGLDRGYLSRLERGLILQPADSRVLKVASALDVTPDDITRNEKKEKTVHTKTPDTGTRPTEAELRHYTPEEVYELRLLPWKPSVLRKKARAHQIPHSRPHGPNGLITFKLAQIREISDLFDVRPIAETKAVKAA